jgi:hypothetical protein
VIGRRPYRAGWGRAPHAACRRPSPGSSGADERGVTLVELLIGMSIMVVVSGLILIIYFALADSFSYSAKSSSAREQARLAVARMTREIRDAEAVPENDEVAVRRARQRWIAVYTTFNEAGNSDPDMVPHLVAYRLYADKEIWRFEDLNGDGVIAGFDINPTPDDQFDEAEQTQGEGASMVVRNVVNYDPTTSPQPPLFQYSYVDDAGQMQTASYVYYTYNRVRILSVQIHVLVDLNPGHSPVYADLQTSAQLRNQRTN